MADLSELKKFVANLPVELGTNIVSLVEQLVDDAYWEGNEAGWNEGQSPVSENTSIIDVKYNNVTASNFRASFGMDKSGNVFNQNGHIGYIANP